MHKRRALGDPRALLAAGLLAAGCTESVGPERRGPGAPLLDVVANGIVLDQWNGTLGQRGIPDPCTSPCFIKGFNPRNPHRGDAIIATFFWLGSTNIIDSVTDHLTQTGLPRVGNTYTLVAYVTQGGISMATYVATNVQNFPDASQAVDSILAVRANLRTPVGDGGVVISAYQGVHALPAQAIGPTSWRFGADDSITNAAAGPIDVSAGALVYGVTMAKGLSGVEPPGGFVRIAGLADDSMNTDAEYAVQASASRVDPQWTWYFDSPGSPRTWLATVLALNPDAGQTLPPAPVADFTSSCSALTCTVDASRSTAQITATYSWNWGDGAPVGAGKTAEHTYGAAGSYDVTLTLTDAGGSSTKTQTVAVTAPAPTGSLAVTTNTTGSSQDPDGYSVSVDGGPSQAIARNGTITVANLVAGSHSVLLSGVAPNCTVSGGPSQAVTVQAGQTATTTFAVSCVAVATRLVFTVQPSTTPPLTAISPAVTVKAVDAAGYTVTSFTGPVTMAIGRNGSLLIPGTLSGTTTVNAVGGVATFSNLKIDQSGDGYTLVARASGLTSAESASFNIRLLVCVLGLCV